MVSFNRNSFKGIVLGYFTDTHFRFNNPIYRKDNFKESILAKLEDVKKIIDTYKIDALLHGGDMFDTAMVSESTWVYFGAQLMQMGIPIYALAGNHDMDGHNEITIPNTPIDYLRQLNIINLIINNKDNPVVINKNGVSVQITGRSYHNLMDEKMKEEDYVLQEKKADYAIHMVHGNLLDAPIIELANFTLIEEIKHTIADLTLSGHYHMGFPLTVIQESGYKKYFYNPGGFVRKTKKEMLRMPTFTLIYISEDGMHIEDIALPSALSTESVLDIEAIERKEAKKEELNHLINDIRSKTQIKRTYSLSDMINNISNQKNVSQNIIDRTMKFIMEAKEEVRGDKK